MKTIIYSFIIIVIISTSCTNAKKRNVSNSKREIIETERKFAQMAQDEGIQKAFLHFAADDVVLLREDRLIKGKDSLVIYYKNMKSPSPNTSLTWKPDFVEVSSSGDLGYTFGKYVYSVIDSTGKKQTSIGVFHTVWKRQSDGNWKFVWD